MTRRIFLGSLAGAALAQARPNLILIVADDLGYAGVSVQGCDIATPNIDSIARNGVRFTDGYVSCPVCSPTRAGLNTGRYQQRFGHEFNPGPATAAGDNFGLPLTETTLADRLRKLGYATGMVGKWHLGFRPEYLPTKRGFDEFFGFLGGAHSYLKSGGRPGDNGNPVMRGTEAVEEKEYLTDAFAREATGFLERNKNRPHFLYMPFNAVHAPMEAVEKYSARFQNIADERRRTHAAMLTALDEAIGRILAVVRANKQESNTLIVFVSDNGGPTPQTTSSNTPLRGFKAQVYEGGIRVPFMMQWPGKIKPGTVYRQPVIALDIHSTLVAAAGGQVPPNLDGVDLVPFVAGTKSGAPHQALYWRFGEQAAIRMGDWKMLRFQEKTELYKLSDDIGESRNLSTSQPEKLRELESAWEKWNAQLVPALWNRGGGGKTGGGKKKKKA